MSHPLGTTMSVAVGVISLALSFLALRAWRRADDVRLLYLFAAFATFAMKGILAVALYWHWLSHNSGELLHSALDLAVILLLVAPFLHRS